MAYLASFFLEKKRIYLIMPKLLYINTFQESKI